LLNLLFCYFQIHYLAKLSKYSNFY